MIEAFLNSEAKEIPKTITVWITTGITEKNMKQIAKIVETNCLKFIFLCILVYLLVLATEISKERNSQRKWWTNSN